MKTSNKILLSFFIFLFGGITLLFIISKYYKGVNDNIRFAIQEKKTAAFSVVVAEPGAHLFLKNGEENKVSQRYIKDVNPDFAPFEVRNDTLFVSASQSIKDGKWFITPEVYAKNIKSIIGKENSNINLIDYQKDTLVIKVDKSSFYSSNIQKTLFVSITARNSYINFNGESIDKLVLDLDKSNLEIYVNNKIKEVTGNLKNNSSSSFNLNGRVNLTIDETSNVRANY